MAKDNACIIKAPSKPNLPLKAKSLLVKALNMINDIDEKFDFFKSVDSNGYYYIKKGNENCEINELEDLIGKIHHLED